MNYFGIIFSFMIPGIILGMLAAGIFYDAKKRKKPVPKKRVARLYIEKL